MARAARTGSVGEAWRGRIVVLAGPGVIDDAAIAGLRAFADAGGLGVANTWGAKGVFAWDSPHHLGTCGLQARDFALLGLADAEAIITTGLSHDESPTERYGLAPIVDIAPHDLGALAGRIGATSTPRNDLYPRLAAVAQPGYVATKVPLHPARAVADLGAALPAGGLVTAEPGLAGLWVARTFPTPALDPGAPRRVVVPSSRAPGVAAQLAVAAASEGRPAIYVSATEPDGETAAVLERAHDENAAVTVVVWGAAGRLDHADDHQERLHEALAATGPTRVDVPVALDDTRLLVEAAGAVVAWGGLTETELRFT